MPVSSRPTPNAPEISASTPVRSERRAAEWAAGKDDHGTRATHAITSPAASGTTDWRRRLARVLIVFVLSKVGLILIGTVTVAVFAPFKDYVGALDFGEYAYGVKGEGYTIFNMWFRWDSMHYLNMIKFDYLTPLTGAEYAQLQAAADGQWQVVMASLHRFTFPPLFPLLAKPLALLVGPAPAMLIIANAALLGCLWFIDVIAERLFGSSEDGRRAMIYLAIFPGAYLLHAALTESLFLFLCLATFHFAWTNRWALVAIFGFALGLTRSSGFTLALALALVALSQADWRFDWPAIKGYLRKSPAIIAPGVAWAAFMGWCLAMTGDAFAYSKLQQSGWLITVVAPWKPFTDTLAEADPDPVKIYKLVFVLVLLGLLLVCMRVLPVAYGVAGLSILLIAMSIGAPWHQSILRYAAVEFPLVLLAVAAAKRWPRHEILWVAPMIVAQTLMMVFWTLPYTMVVI